MLHSKEKLELLKFARSTFKDCEAYRKFLNSKGITLKKFPEIYEEIPLTDKNNYIEKYPVEKRLYKSKKVADYYMICTSSGSTGEPTIWPRDFEQDKRAIDFNYAMYKELFGVENKSTLVVVTFGLGAWTAGMLTSRLCWEMPKTAKLSVVTPGLDKEVSLRVIKRLSKYYDQTIITGYPPFIIDLIEYGHRNGFDFRSINTKIHFTSARLLESQRRELARLISRKGLITDVLGFYASSEAGIIGIETRDTVKILDYASKNKELSNALFKNPVPPSFIKYNPKVRYLEEYKGRLILTVNQPIPLVRYDTKDRGGVFTGEFLAGVCKKFDISCPSSLISENFAYIYGRTDAVRLLSNVYIEDIQYCLQKSPVAEKFTGNFKYGLEDAGLRNILKVMIYLRSGETLSSSDRKKFFSRFLIDLAEINPDFRMVSTGINFKFKVLFSAEPINSYKGGKFNYHL